MSGHRGTSTPLSLMDPALERTLKGHKSYITSVAFSSTLKQIASGSADNNIMLWNFKPQLRAFRFIGHKSIVTSIEFSPEGDILASGSKDKTVRLWTPNAMGESVVLKGHTGAVRSVKFSNDGKNLITASDDKLAKVWSLPSRKFSCSLVGHSNWVRSACFGAHSTLAATGSDDKLVKLWDVPTHQCLHSFHDHNDVVNQVLLHPDGGCLSSCSADKSIKIWDIKSRQLIQHYPAHNDAVTSISLHESGLYLMSSSKDSSLKIWDLREGRLLFTLQSHTGPVRAASFSHDGNFFASGGADQMLMVWKSNLVGVQSPELDWGSNSHKPVYPSSTSLQNGEIVRATSANPPSKRPGVPKQLSKKTVEDENTSPQTQIHITKPQAALAGMTTVETGMDDVDTMKGSATSIPTAGFVDKERLPESLSYTLDYIVGQLDIMTRTMGLLEQRISMTEDRLSNVVAYSRGMVEVPASIGREAMLPMQRDMMRVLEQNQGYSELPEREGADPKTEEGVI